MTPSRSKVITPAQRRALRLAERKGGAPVGTAKGSIRAQTANLLVLREWVTISNEVVLITKAGRKALHDPIPEDPPVFLRRRDGLTTRMDQRVVEEPEVMDVGRLRKDWREHSAKLHEASRADTAAAVLSSLPTSPAERAAAIEAIALQRAGAVQTRSERRALRYWMAGGHDSAVDACVTRMGRMVQGTNPAA